jgi:hypothetical protein
MKLVAIWITGVNVCISGFALLAVAGASGVHKNNQFQTGMARIAVRERLDGMLSLTPDSMVRLNKGCAEKNDSGGLIVGSGEASSSSRVMEGVPVREASRFSYRANVSANCDVHNLNCYQVENIDVNGSRSIIPRL